MYILFERYRTEGWFQGQGQVKLGQVAKEDPNNFVTSLEVENENPKNEATYIAFENNILYRWGRPMYVRTADLIYIVK